MTEASPTAVAQGTRPRTAHVTAVLVTRGPSEYLSTTLSALAAQTRRLDRLLVVDAADDAADDAGWHAGEEMLNGRADRALQPAGLLDGSGSGGTAVTAVRVPGARTLGDAVRGALEQLEHLEHLDHLDHLDRADGGRGSDRADGRWLWLLHDDSAPAPTALAELMRAVELAPSVAVAGCKQHTWSEPVRVLEAGLATSRFGRRMTGIDEPEVDQGQHDGREDVLGVGTAGALVRRDVWDELGGTDPALGPYGDGLDLCRRARLAGHRVVVVPKAVVRHAQASLALPTGGAVVNRPGWDARRSAQARRQAYLHSQLAGVPAGLVPVVAVLAVVSGVVRALGRFVTKEPHLVVAELVAPWAALARPHRVLRARRNASRTRRLSRRSLRPLQVTWRDVVQQAGDRRLTAAERRRNRRAPSELELAELAALRTRRRLTLAAVLVAATAVTAVALGPLITRVTAGARLTGGTLAFGDATAGELWSGAMSGWLPAGLGEPGPVEPLLVALVPVAAVTGTLGAATALLLLTSVLAAAVGGWFAAGAATRSVALRAWAALVWAAAPPLLIGLTQARFGAVLAHVALPWVALGVARAVGLARVDVVESGLVGAHRSRAATADAVSERMAARARAATAPAPVRTAEASLAAAAGAGLGFAVMTAAAPVLLPAGLLSLLVVAALARRRRRLAWVAVPAVVLHGPMIVEAVGSWARGGWRLLVADPGVPVASVPAPSWQQLLGWPTAPPQWVALPDAAALVVPLAATGVVVLVALLSLVLGGAAARAVRVGWLVAAIGVAAALVASRVEVGVADDPALGEVLATGWPGSGVSLALAGLTTAAVVGATGFRSAMAGRSFGWRQLSAAVVTVAAVVGPAAVLGAWTWQVRADQDRALQVATVPVVPAVGVQMQESAQDVRVLALDLDEEGRLDATLLRQDGRQLTELSRATTGRDLTGGYGQAQPARPSEAQAEVAEVAARLAAGTSDQVAASLADLGIGAVLVAPLDGPGGGQTGTADVRTTGARAEVVGRIDSTLGLERVTQTESGVIWRVAAAELGTTTAWARVLAESGSGSDGPLPLPVPSVEGAIDTDLPAGDAGRLLVLAENADQGWKAWLDGEPLRAVELSWRQAFEIGPQGGRLTVEHVPAGRTPWLVLQGLVLLLTVLLALPFRRRRGGAR